MEQLIYLSAFLRKNGQSQGASVVQVKNIFFYPPNSRMFADLAIIIKADDNGDLVQWEIILLLDI